MFIQDPITHNSVRLCVGLTSSKSTNKSNSASPLYWVIWRKCCMHHLKKRKSSPSLSTNSCRALNEPDCRGSWGSSWSFCNIRYTSDSSMLVNVLGLSSAVKRRESDTRIKFRKQTNALVCRTNLTYGFFFTNHPKSISSGVGYSSKPFSNV